MKHLYTYSIPLLILILACGNTSPQQLEISETKEIEAPSPIDEFQKFVKELESINWIADTNRLNKVSIYSSLDRSKTTYFDDRPYYPIQLIKSRVYKTFKSESMSEELSKFENVKSIWGYFYLQEGATEMISDGVIEQWEFENETKAEEALETMEKHGSYVFFNTTPYFYRIDNYLFMFHTRAMKFSYDQREVYGLFVLEQDAN